MGLMEATQEIDAALGIVAQYIDQCHTAQAKAQRDGNTEAAKRLGSSAMEFGLVISHLKEAKNEIQKGATPS